MNRNGTVAVCLVFVLLSLPLAPFAANDAPPDQSAEAMELLEYRLGQQQPASDDVPTVDSEVEVIVYLKENASVPESQQYRLKRVYTEEGKRYARGSVPLSSVRALVDDPRTRAVQITSSQRIHDGQTASGVDTIKAGTLHEQGITGDNVTVGVIDSGFWVGHPAIAGSVNTSRSFGSDGDWRHGTAVASVVVDTAPNANLTLASIGPTTTPEEYAAAVEWLEQSGADVIVDGGSYYTQPGNGTGEISKIATNVSDDIVFVTSVGNHAQRYWDGNYSGNNSSDEWVTFHEGTQANPLNGGERFSGTVRVTLRWDDGANVNGDEPNETADFDLYLLRKQPGDDAVVARATRHDGRPYEYLETSVPPGRYYVSVRASEGPGPGTTNHLELFANRDLRYRSTGGQAAPADASGVLAVGAIENGSVKSFSAQGADIVAPDEVTVEGATIDGGTSFSAPYVAGTAALVLSENPSATPAEVRTVLTSTAVDVGPEGVDNTSGYGLLNATRALELANRTDETEPIENRIARGEKFLRLRTPPVDWRQPMALRVDRLEEARARA